MTRSRTARSRTAGSGAALPAALISALRALRRGRYRSALERFSDYLGMNDGIETTERQWTPPLPPAELAAAVDELPLTPDLASFYAQVGGVTLRWTCSDAGITGALCIRPLPKVLRGLVFEASPDAWFKESARSKPFDLASNDSVTRLRLLRNEPDGGTALALEHEHRLASSSGVATLMRSDDVARPLDAYLELVLLSRGFLFWQQVWLIAQSLGGPPKTPSLEETRLWRAAVRAWPDLPFAGLLAPLGAQRSDTTATFECAVRSVVGRDVVLEIAPTGAWGDLARPDAAALLEMLREAAPPGSPLHQAIQQEQLVDDARLARCASERVEILDANRRGESEEQESWQITLRVSDASLASHLSGGQRWWSNVEPPTRP